jgi:hypothetical protein
MMMRQPRMLKNAAVTVRLDRTIQYAGAFAFVSGRGGYWMPAFAGMTGETRGTT